MAAHGQRNRISRAGIALIALLAAWPATAEAPGDLMVGRAAVVDGDTIEIRGVRVRLEGIDAPEARQWCEGEAGRWPCGRAAAFALADFVAARTVRCERVGRDRWQRFLGRCSVGGTDIADWLVREGWALAFRRYSTAYAEAEAEARAKLAGLWSGSFVLPWDFRRGVDIAVDAASYDPG
jgi:endonuclease YncB( thermonuclease family)